METNPQDFERTATVEWMIFRLAHEMRTPLTSILSWIRMVRSGRLSSQEMERGLDTMERSAKYQARMLEDVLEVVTLLGHKRELQWQDVDVTKVLGVVVENATILAAQKDVRVLSSIDEREGVVYGDQNSLQRIFDNLLTTAVGNTDSGKAIHIDSQVFDRSMKVSIQDEGKGFSSQTLPHVFDPVNFVASGGHIAGLGAGLLIVRELVKLHGGSVEAESNAMMPGSRFLVSFPLSAEDKGSLSSPLQK